jgi:hypothetical protein
VRRLLPLATILIAAALGAWLVRGGLRTPPRDTSPEIAAELARWTKQLEDTSRADEFWNSVKPGATTMLTQAGQALADGRRLMAVERLLAGRHNLSAANYVNGLPAGAGADPAVLESEWQRMGGVLGLDRPRPSAADVAPSGSAYRRAVQEAAFLQLKINYDASLAYGRNTTPQSGLAYIGIAQAHREIGELAASIVPEDGRRAPRLRSLRPDVDALQAELLTAYRPPASIENHPDFIATSALLKEARELDAAGLPYGALYRYLQAAMRYGMLTRTPEAARSRTGLDARIAEARARASAGRTDHSLAVLFVERAEFDLAHAAAADAPVPIAHAVIDDVLPRYYAALEPSTAAPRPADAPVTITLVRWPYT